jgi:hypothetical protein
MKICNVFLGLAEYSAIRMEGVNNNWGTTLLLSGKNIVDAVEIQ